MTKPVLLFNAVPHVNVAIARSLSRRGIDTFYADIRGNGSAPASNAIERFLQLPDFEADPIRFKEALSEAISKYGFDVLLPCSDPGLVAAIENHHWLQSRLYVGCPNPATVRQVLDKSKTLEAAVQCGIAVPKRIWISDLQTLDSLRSELRFPLIAKPLTKEDESTHAFKMSYIASFDDLRDAFILNPGFGSNHLLQEFCRGEGVGVELLLHDGEAVAVFQHRRLKELPIGGGGSVTSVSEPVDAQLLDQSLALLRRLGWQGVAMVEFKRDRPSNRSVLMEVNGRYWGSLPLAIAAGVDFPLYEWQLAHGFTPTPPRQYTSGMHYRWLAGDIRRIASLIHNQSNDSFPRPPLSRELAIFFTDFRYKTSPALWSWSDPLPAIAETAAALRKCLGALARRILANIKSVRDNYRYHGGAILLAVLWTRFSTRLVFKRSPRLSDFSRPRSILFVCHGNIIRSAMAEALLRKVSLSSDYLRDFKIASAGLTRKPEPHADSRARVIAREFGISLEEHRPARISPGQIDEADVILIMDAFNEAYLARDFPQARRKIVYLGSVTPGTQTRMVEIVDPYSGTLGDIRNCFHQLGRCVHALVHFLEKPASNSREESLAPPSARQTVDLAHDLRTDLHNNRSATELR